MNEPRGLNTRANSTFAATYNRVQRAGQATAQTLLALTAIGVSVIVGAHYVGGGVNTDLTETSKGMADPAYLVSRVSGKGKSGSSAGSGSGSNSGGSNNSSGDSGSGSGGGSNSGSNESVSGGDSGDSGSSGSGSSGGGGLCP